MVAQRTLPSDEYWIQAFKAKNAFFMHDGNRRRPHPKLTSGNHSNGFFNGEMILEDPTLLDEIAIALVSKLERAGANLRDIDRVVGPAMGAITLAHDIARHIEHEALEDQPPKHTLRAYTEKDTRIIVSRRGHATEIDSTEMQNGDLFLRYLDKKMVFKKTQIRRGERVLSVEDTFTTGGSLQRSTAAVIDAGGIDAKVVSVIMDRSDVDDEPNKPKMFGDKYLVSLVRRRLPIWAPGDCPLCKEGSEAISAKGENWLRLNANY